MNADALGTVTDDSALTPLSGKGVVDWISTNAGHLLREGQSPLDAALWFIAMEDARMVFETWRYKDLAAAILSGHPIGGPYKKLRDLDDWLRVRLEGLDGNAEATRMAVLAALRGHFHIRGDQQ